MSVIVIIRAKPGSSRQKITLDAQGNLIIYLVSRAEKGRANDEIIDFLAKTLSCAKKEIIIIRGHTCTIKKIMIRTLDTLEAFFKALKLDKQTHFFGK